MRYVRHCWASTNTDANDRDRSARVRQLVIAHRSLFSDCPIHKRQVVFIYSHVYIRIASHRTVPMYTVMPCAVTDRLTNPYIYKKKHSNRVELYSDCITAHNISFGFRNSKEIDVFLFLFSSGITQNSIFIQYRNFEISS